MNIPAITERLRAVCLALPDTSETTTFNNPTFRSGKNTFAVISTHHPGTLILCFKVEKQMQPVFLEDSRFFKTPYIGQHGWLSLALDGAINWDEVAELVSGSHDLASRKKGPRKKAS